MERRVTALPEAAVSVTSEVVPEYAEYEWFTATMLNAYVAPRLHLYLGRPQSGQLSVAPASCQDAGCFNCRWSVAS